MRLKISAVIVVLVFITITVSMVSASLIDVKSSDATVINNSLIDYSKMSQAQKQAIVDKAISDYMNGNTNTLIIPGVEKINLTGKPVSKVPSDWINLPPPTVVNKSFYITNNYGSGITPNIVTPGETLNYISDNSENYAATYIAAGGINSYTPDVRASSGDATISHSFISDMQPGEIFVLHQWGTISSSGGIAENDIVIGQNQSNQDLIDFTPYINTLFNNNGHWGPTIPCPKSDDFSIYVKIINPNGLNYQQVELCVFDVTAFQWYYWSYTLEPQIMDRVDMALEKAYGEYESRPGSTLLWRSATTYHAYDQNLNRINLVQSGVVYEWLTSNVNTAYYHDFIYYIDTQNGQGTYYFTRYNGSWYPSHP